MSSKKDGSAGRQSRFRIDIGIVIFAAIFIYLAANSIFNATRGRVSFFEVESGEIVDEDSFTGLIVRDEQIIKSPRDGYISYFVSDGEKAAKDENVCIINSQKPAQTSTAAASLAASLSDSQYSDIREQMNSFNRNYSDSRYSDVQSLDYSLSNIISQIISRNNINSLAKLTSSGEYQILKAPANGVISYTTDGMEGTGTDSLSADLFNTSGYRRTQIETGSEVKAADPVCRIIYEDDWQLIIRPSQEQLKKFKEKDSVTVSFLKDNLTAQAVPRIIEKDGTEYVSLQLSNYMVRYCNERYLDIKIIWDSSSGLKIPASALAKQDYYTIPVSFAVTDKNSSQTGFYSRNGSSIEFIKPDIVYMDDENCYIDPEDLPENTEIVSEDKSKTFKVSGKSSLSGVFNINRGYTLFCPVKVLYTYGDYCIVENLSGSGLVLYDHIILDGSTVKNNQVIY